MVSREDHIAVFDSGVGGISVLRHLVRLLPEENYLYFGDSANAPYGTKTKEEICRLTLESARMLMDRNVKALVIACNTATSAAIDILRQKYPDRIIIGIEPALKLAADRFPGGRIGVMATDVTLAEEKFHLLRHRFDHQCTVTAIHAPGLVPLIEHGQGDSEQCFSLLESILGQYRGKLDALVLGCTHYPFVSGTISRVLGPDTVLLDGGEGTARETKRRLQKENLLRSGHGTVHIENSSGDPKIIALCRHLLNP